MGKLKVVKAAYAGACYGVQRALDMTLKAAEAGGSVCTLGPLIHNPGVVAELEERGICVADSVDSIHAAGFYGDRRNMPACYARSTCCGETCQGGPSRFSGGRSRPS